ncbi:partial tRNA nuclease WapA, partial [Myxococcaceae bacterium]
MICRRAALWSLLALIGLASPLTAGAVCTPGDPLLQADAPDVVLSPEIREEAEALGFEPARIYEWVRNEFRYEAYYGLMKGPEGTLAARAGNDYDLAALLVSLLRVSEDVDGDCVLGPDEDLDQDGRLDGATRARFVRGRIRVPVADARAWTGADDGGGTAAVCAGNGACSLWYWAEPDGWRAQPGLGVEALPSAAPTHVEKLHVWVEADVSLAHYRGAGLDPRAPSGAPGSASLTSWVPLDPSFKRQEIGMGLALSIGRGAGQIHFDPRNYYAEIQQQLPLEVFKSQIRSYLASSTVPEEQGKTLRDVPYRGPIERVEVGVLPNALPYALSAALVPARDANLAPLHGENSPGTNGTSGPGGYRYKLLVKTCASVSAGICTGTGIDWSAWGAELVGRRLTLSYPSSVPASAVCTPAADATPTLWLDGASVATATPLPRCQAQVLLLTVEPPLVARKAQADYPVAVGSTLGIGIDMGWASASLVQRAADALVQAVEVDYPLGEDANGNGIIRTTGQLLSSDYTAQERVTGGLLHLAAERYFAELRRDYREIADLHHQIVQPVPWFGVVQSGLEIDATLEQPFLVRPARFLLDMKGLFYKNFDRYGLWFTYFDHAVDLLTFQGSAREHETWESLLDVEAISTVKGLQVQDAIGNPALVIESAADAAAATASCNTSNVIDWGNWINAGTFAQATYASGLFCSGIDAWTYCTIRDRFAPQAELKTTVRWTLVNVPPGYGFPSPTAPVDFEATDQFFLYSPHAEFYHWKALFWDAYVCRNGKAEMDALRGARVPVSYHVPSKGVFNYFDFTGGVWVDKRYDLVDGQYFARTSMAIETTTGVLEGAYDLGLALDWGNLRLDDYRTGTSIDLDDLFTNGYPGYARWFDIDAETIGVRNHAWAVTDPFSAVFGGDPVSVATGNLNHTETDLEIPGRGGLGLRLLRSYNSRLEYDGPLGHGWTHSYDQNLRVDASDPAARKMIFLDERGGETVFGDTASGLVAPAWSHLALVRETESGVTTGYRMTWKDGTVYRFLPEDVHGKAKLRSITDRNGNAVTLTYDGAGWLTAVTDTAGRQLVFENDAAGHLEEIRDWASPQRRWRYAVDAAGDLVSYMNPREVARGANGRATVYDYYEAIPNGPRLAHNLERVIQPASRDADAAGDVWTQFYYYANDAVYKHTTSQGETTRFDYDFFRRRTTVTQPDGAREVFVFDRNLEVVRYESARGVVHEYEYAPGARDRLVERDGFGRETRATYDGVGNLTSRTDRTGKTERFTYNGFSQPRTHTDRRGSVRRWEYDAKGNLLRSFVTIGGAEQVVEEALHDAYGNPIERVAHAGTPGAAPARTRLEMAPNGVDVARVIDAVGHSARFTRDLLGRPTRVERERTVASPSRTFTETVAVSTEWDELDRAVAETDPAGTVRKTIYDENGNVIRRETLVPGMPPRTDVTRVFDDADRLASVSDALSNTTRFEYDARGRLVRTISALGNVSTIEYDPDGNVVKEIDPTGAITTHAYDVESRRTLSTDPVGRRIRTEYDAEGRVKRRYESADPLVYPAGERLVYEALELDEEGNATRVRDAKGRETEISYDELGRKTLVRGPLFPVPQNPSPDETTTRFEYDLAGRLLARTEAVGQPEERTTRVRYDALGRPIEALDPLGRSRTYGYDELGNTTVVHLPTGEEVR